MTRHESAEHLGAAASESWRAIDAKLDAALADTFPASDPVAITVSRSRPDHVDGNTADIAEDLP